MKSLPNLTEMVENGAQPNETETLNGHDQNALMQRKTRNRRRKSELVPLSTTWTLWFDRIETQQQDTQHVTSYGNNLKKICDISSVQHFWGIYNNVPKIGSMGFKHYYYLMKADVQPKWEDPMNANGGVWSLRVPKAFTNAVWEDILLLTIGGQFNDVLTSGDVLTGVSVSVRFPDDVIQIWTHSAEKCNDRVQDLVRTILPHEIRHRRLFYKVHRTRIDYKTKS